jgi:iron complex outermembrane receptor protein
LSSFGFFRLAPGGLSAALSLVAMTTPIAAQTPDSVVAIEPLEVRVLASAIGTGTPHPISVITGSQLTRGTSSIFIEEAVRAVPGVQIQNRFNLAQGERIVIRGVGPRAQFGVRGIRILVDGIPATLPDGQATLDHLDLAGLARVEVLRGPNATLYGNAAGGVLHFRTADPAQGPTQVGLRWTGGTLGTTTGAGGIGSTRNDMWTLEGSATGAVGQLGYRVGLTRTDFDGYRRNPVADDGSTFGAGTRATLNGTATLPLADGTLRFVANGVDLDADNPGSLAADAIDDDRNAWRGNVSQGTRKEARQGQLGVSWTGTVRGMASEFAAWGIRRELYNPIPSAVIDLTRNAGGARALVKGSLPLGMAAALGWSAGVESEFQRDARLNYANSGGAPGALTLDQRERVGARGAFAQGRLDAGGGISLLAGARFDHVTFGVDDELMGGPDDSGARAMNAFSPSVGLVVGPWTRLELYASAGRSFETPTTTELANRPSGAGGFNPDLDPQTGVTVEGGARVTLSDNARLEAAIFNTVFQNQLVPYTVPGADDRDFYRNAAESRSRGWELSADWRLTPDLSSRIAWTRVDAVFTSYETESGAVYTGNAVPGLAPNRVDGLLMYQRGITFVELRGLWQDDVPVDDAGTSTSPSHFVMDARIGAEDLTWGSARLSPFLGIANLFDATYNASVVPNAFGRRYFEPGPPRTYRIGVGLTWGR